MDSILTLTIILVFMIIALLLYLYRGRRYTGDDRKEEAPPPALKQFTTCLLCGSGLQRGERMHTEVYRGENYSVVHITGCPYCNGISNSRTRNCPQCGRDVPLEGYLIGKMWKKKDGRIHVQVSGCNRCAYSR